MVHPIQSDRFWNFFPKNPSRPKKFFFSATKFATPYDAFLKKSANQNSPLFLMHFWGIHSIRIWHSFWYVFEEFGKSDFTTLSNVFLNNSENQPSDKHHIGSNPVISVFFKTWFFFLLWIMIPAIERGGGGGVQTHLDSTKKLNSESRFHDKYNIFTIIYNVNEVNVK